MQETTVILMTIYLYRVPIQLRHLLLLYAKLEGEH